MTGHDIAIAQRAGRLAALREVREMVNKNYCDESDPDKEDTLMDILGEIDAMIAKEEGR